MRQQREIREAIAAALTARPVDSTKAAGSVRKVKKTVVRDEHVRIAEIVETVIEG
jgi:hypothetical protein